MLHKNILHFFSFCILFSLSVSSLTLCAQSVNNLEKQRIQKENEKKQLAKDIDLTSKLLEETKKTKTASLNQLEVLSKQISTRIKLIMAVNGEIQVLNRQIQEINSIIKALEKDLKNLKEEYAKMIYHAYKNRSSYSRLMFLFAADDFKQAYKRLQFLKQFSQYRQKQAELIESTRQSLTGKVSDLEKKKNEKNLLIQSKEKETKTLNGEKKIKKELVNNLQSKEKQLKKEIEDKQKSSERLTKAIEDIIRKEIEARKVRSGIELTPEAKQLSENFEANKGKLPWPVEKGIITGVFGKQPHPVLKGVEINNNGIDIKTNTGAEVRSVFDGEVTGVVTIPGANKAVIIRHGEYLTVYSNLKKVYVNRGDKVKTKESIGIVHTNELDGNTEVHFELWHNTSKMNPSHWIFLE